MKQLRTGLAAFALLALLVSPGLALAQEDPESVFRAVVDAVTARDEDALVALFSDDATLTFTWGDETETVTGKEAIREDLGADDEATNQRVEIADLQVDGERVTATLNLFDDELEAAGVSPAVFNADATVQSGKITSLTLATDPEWVARAEAAMGPMDGMAAETPDAMAAETPTAAGPGEAETPTAMTEGDQGAAMGDAGAEGGMGPGKLPASGSDTTNWLLVSLLGILGLGGLGAGAWIRGRAA
jgi:hypothetical protein